MRRISILFLMAMLLFSCNTKEFNTLSEYSNTSIKFVKRQIIDKKLDFKVSIPIAYNIKIEKNISDNIILSFSAKSEKTNSNNQSWISIQKVRGFKKNVSLQSEFNNSVDIILDFNEVEIFESGTSKTLKYDSFFLHTKPEIENSEKIDFIMFVLESNEDNMFYNISVMSPVTKDLKNNMAMLISCIKTFEKI